MRVWSPGGQREGKKGRKGIYSLNIVPAKSPSSTKDHYSHQIAHSLQPTHIHTFDEPTDPVSLSLSLSHRHTHTHPWASAPSRRPHSRSGVVKLLPLAADPAPSLTAFPKLPLHLCKDASQALLGYPALKVPLDKTLTDTRTKLTIADKVIFLLFLYLQGRFVRESVKQSPCL